MDEHDLDADRRRYLTIYLQDHRAGAETGVRLAKRCRDHAPDTDTEAELSRLVAEIDHDRRTLITIMAGLDIDPSKVKHIAGLATERLGRLKFNGHAVRTSPLSVLLEVEAMIGAVAVKRQLWTTLISLATEEDARGPELDDLVRRADDQRLRLEAIHGRIAGRLFTAPVASSTTSAAPANVDLDG